MAGDRLEEEAMRALFQNLMAAENPYVCPHGRPTVIHISRNELDLKFGRSKKPLIPALVGPTAIGKTAVALELADRLNLEIVSCDSRQIYRHLDIGTGKPTREELRGHPYHLIDFVELTDVFSAARYRVEAEKVIDNIFARGKLPLVVGGPDSI